MKFTFSLNWTIYPVMMQHLSVEGLFQEIVMDLDVDSMKVRSSGEPGGTNIKQNKLIYLDNQEYASDIKRFKHQNIRKLQVYKEKLSW